MTGSILLGIFIIILVLAAVLVVRTCSRQPTPAMTASVELDKGPRAREYGEQLSKMIQKETVSSRLIRIKQNIMSSTKFWRSFSLWCIKPVKNMFSMAIFFLNGAGRERRSRSFL